jgi:hypothetical protein
MPAATSHVLLECTTTTSRLGGRRQRCQLTDLCATDAHPTDTGYALLGHRCYDTSGWQRLAR